ncbi:MAG: alpha/beta hydrolase [Xanthobacteraceae bacterium]|nr:alpha/beta hydrolase [Xanthobacteraceae bacterium]
MTMRGLLKFIRRSIATIVTLAAAVFVFHFVSPWPSALFFRGVFYLFTVQITSAIEKHVPSGVVSFTDQIYDPTSSRGKFDVYFPADALRRKLPTIVWIHGGGFISGSRKDVASYAKILASNGYAVVTVGYTIAPEQRYPGPVYQVNAALAEIVKMSNKFPFDVSQIVLAGDSAGAQIAAQTALVISDQTYAREVGIEPGLLRGHLIGLILHCGVLDAKLLGRGDGLIGFFLRTVGRSYFGTEDFSDPVVAKQFSVADRVTGALPPVFISAGNRDPLLLHSLSMVRALESVGVRTEKLFYPEDQAPPLDHEYQFNLDTAAGKLALSRTLEFLQTLKK